MLPSFWETKKPSFWETKKARYVLIHLIFMAIRNYRDRNSKLLVEICRNGQFLVRFRQRKQAGSKLKLVIIEWRCDSLIPDDPTDCYGENILKLQLVRDHFRHCLIYCTESLRWDAGTSLLLGRANGWIAAIIYVIKICTICTREVVSIWANCCHQHSLILWQEWCLSPICLIAISNCSL